MDQTIGMPFWQAAVYTRPDSTFGTRSGKKVYTELFQTREEAERAGNKLCQKIKGRGVVCLKIETE